MNKAARFIDIDKIVGAIPPRERDLSKIFLDLTTNKETGWKCHFIQF